MKSKAVIILLVFSVVCGSITCGCSFTDDVKEGMKDQAEWAKEHDAGGEHYDEELADKAIDALSDDSEKDDDKSKNKEKSKSNAKKQEKYHVGDTVNFEDEDGGKIAVTITDWGIDQDQLNNTITYMVYEVENIGKQNTLVGNGMFNIYADNYSVEQTYMNKAIADAELSAGRKMTGYIYAKVDADTVNTIELECGDTVFAIKEDVSDEETANENQDNEVSNADDSEYVFPNSDSEYISFDDLQGLSQPQCKIARNEIYARHGRMFNDTELQKYFNGCSWYTGTIKPENFSDSMLNEVELKNLQIIKEYEENIGY